MLTNILNLNSYNVGLDTKIIEITLVWKKLSIKNDFHAENGRHLDKWPPSLSGKLLPVSR